MAARIRQAVYAALDVVGGTTSVDQLQKEASKILGRPINRGTVQIYRLDWRKDRGIVQDARTYKTQPRRNMLSDSADIRHVKSVAQQIKNPTKFLSVLTGFHSLDQLKNAVKQLEFVRAYTKAA